MDHTNRPFAALRTSSPAGSAYRASFPTIGYRADLDALRALAVIGVILFHAGFERVGGGFVGVDIFFVISGFLITQLMIRDLENGTFSLANFYHRRIKRIFPALMLMLALCTIACTWLLLPDDLQRYGQSTTATAFFSSNIWFWLKTDYFDGPALFKPLLHTWSLAVEEQFYLFFPLFLRFIWPFGKATTQIILATCAALSFIASLSIMETDASAAFYLTPFRAWELLMGSLLAAGAIPAITRPVLREIAAATGLALIFFAILTYSELTIFPGMAALAPCLGTALVIHAGSSGSCAVNRALAIKPLVFVGLISYSLYLWHWPIIVLARYLTIDELQWPSMGLLIVLSFAAAWLSYFLVEQPFRTSAIKCPRVTITACIIVTVGSAAAGLAIHASRGWPQRFSADVSRLENYKNSENPVEDKCQRVKVQLARNSPCTIGDPAKASIFLWGDSHAGVLYSALAEIAKNGSSTIYAASSRCPPLLQLGTDPACIRGNEHRLRYLRKHPEIRTVILAARWSLYLEGRAIDIGPDETNGNTPILQWANGEQLERFSPAARMAFNRSLHQLVDALIASGKKIVLVYPVPELGYDVPSRAARMMARGENPATFTIPASVYFRRQDHALAMLDSLGNRPELTRIYPEHILCPGNRCLSVLHGTPLYFDSHHLSKPGSRLLMPALQQAIAIRYPRTSNTASVSAEKKGRKLDHAWSLR